MHEPYAEIHAVLPICLHLDERVFSFEAAGRSIELHGRNIASEDETWLGRAENMEVDSDEFSHFRFTVVTVRISHAGGYMEGREVLERYDNVFFEALNRFIACCRVVLGRHGLRYYSDHSQFMRPVVATIVGTVNPGREYVAAFNFGRGLVPARAIRSGPEHEQIGALLRDGIPIPQTFLSDAMGYLYHGDTLHALISAVIALEVKVSDSIRTVAARRGIDEDSIKTFIHDVGLTGNIKTTVRLLAPEGLALPSDDIFGGCKGAITVRNQIVHQGRRGAGRDEVTRWVEQIGQLIRFCDDWMRHAAG